MVTLIPSYTVYYNSSTSAGQLIYLLLKSLNLEKDPNIKLIDTDVEENLLADILVNNPEFTVPSLVDHTANDLVIWESYAIATYIVESRAPEHSIYPMDPLKRAIVNQRLYFDADTLFPRVEKILKSMQLGLEGAVVREDEDKLYEAFGWLDSFLESYKWVASNEPTVADIAIFCSLVDVVELGASISKFTKLSVWYNKLQTFAGFDTSVERARKKAVAVLKNNKMDTVEEMT